MSDLRARAEHMLAVVHAQGRTPVAWKVAPGQRLPDMLFDLPVRKDASIRPGSVILVSKESEG